MCNCFKWLVIRKLMRWDEQKCYFRKISEFWQHYSNAHRSALVQLSTPSCNRSYSGCHINVICICKNRHIWCTFVPPLRSRTAAPRALKIMNWNCYWHEKGNGRWSVLHPVIGGMLSMWISWGKGWLPQISYTVEPFSHAHRQEDVGFISSCAWTYTMWLSCMY